MSDEAKHFQSGLLLGAMLGMGFVMAVSVITEKRLDDEAVKAGKITINGNAYELKPTTPETAKDKE